jgi:hypothetical protein
VNPAFLLEGCTGRLFSQFLFSYKLNAQTVALLGYAWLP